MKRKKWSEQEEQSLLSKYSEMQSSGALSKLKTREKKFRPVADHVNAAHHSSDPTAFPFRWSWRDVSIKVQNMRHQYLCVKQKIRLSGGGGFNWDDGDNHWQNFLAYKSVFGDIDLDSRPPKRPAEEDDSNNNSITDDSSEDDGEEGEEEEFDEMRSEAAARRAFRRERAAAAAEEEERERWRRREEERREEEEMEWRERMLAMQLHHEKEMLRVQAEAFQSQAQVLGAMVRLLCQFFGGGGADVLGNQVLGNLEHQNQHHHDNHHHHHHHGGGGGPELGDNGKPDANSPSGFI